MEASATSYARPDSRGNGLWLTALSLREIGADRLGGVGRGGAGRG